MLQSRMTKCSGIGEGEWIFPTGDAVLPITWSLPLKEVEVDVPILGRSGCSNSGEAHAPVPQSSRDLQDEGSI